MNEDKIIYDEALITAYIAGELNPSTAKQVESWIAKNEENNKFYSTILSTWELTAKIKPTPVVVNKEVAWEQVKTKLNTNDQKVIEIPRSSNRKLYWSIAAMVVALVGIFSIIQIFNSSPINQTTFAKNEVLSVGLEDGSAVTLNKNSVLSNPATFSENERRVALTGEAFFEIARDEEKPFIIDLPSETFVKVLGTSFNIKANQGDSVTTVFVKTGKVEFGTSSNSIILLPGEQGEYHHQTKDLVKINGSSVGAAATLWLDGEVDLDHVPLFELVELLNDVYPEAEIKLGCSDARNTLINSTLEKDKSLDDFLRIVVSVHGLSYQKEVDETKTKYIIQCE